MSLVFNAFCCGRTQSNRTHCIACHMPFSGRDSLEGALLSADFDWSRFERTVKDNARLRALIGQAEKSDRGDGFQLKCPWCGSVLGGDPPDTKTEPHQDDCPAFTPKGGVR